MNPPIHAHRTSPHVAGNDREVTELAQVIADWINAEQEGEGFPVDRATPTAFDTDLARHILRCYRRLA